jgi:excisionase family DNA binding protein
MSIPSTGLSRDERRRLVTNVDDACAMLDCSKDTLYGLLSSGKIESYLDGRSRKIIIASIEAYIARRLAGSKQFTRARYPTRRENLTTA